MLGGSRTIVKLRVSAFHVSIVAAVLCLFIDSDAHPSCADYVLSRLPDSNRTWSFTHGRVVHPTDGASRWELILRSEAVWTIWEDNCSIMATIESTGTSPLAAGVRFEYDVSEDAWSYSGPWFGESQRIPLSHPRFSGPQLLFGVSREWSKEERYRFSLSHTWYAGVEYFSVVLQSKGATPGFWREREKWISKRSPPHPNWPLRPTARQVGDEFKH